MAFGSNSPRRQSSSIAVRLNNLLVLVVGIFLGFLASSFLSTASLEPQQRTLIESLRKDDYHAKLSKEAPSETAGWNTIHVFYGNTSHIGEASQISSALLKSKRWFSQVRQDEVVSQLLRGKRDGFFVDLASNDAVRISNTYALETFYGWTGLCLEANPLYWSGLAYRPGCQVIAAVLGQQMMQEVPFRFPHRAAPKGGIVDPKFDNEKASDFGEDQLRYTVTLAHVLDRFHAPSVMDYLSLDVEGAESFVMSTFPFDRYRFRLLTVERPDEELCRLLVQHGYRLLKQLKNWGETIWAHELADDLDLSALDLDTETYEYSEKL